VKRAEAALADAQAELEAAQAMPVSEPCSDCHQSRATAVAEALEAVAAAQGALARARQWLAEALEAAADLAASMRAGLQRRHGGIQEAVDSAPVPAADRGFYSPGGN
jgi:hypothetical protein